MARMDLILLPGYLRYQRFNFWGIDGAVEVGLE